MTRSLFTAWAAAVFLVASVGTAWATEQGNQRRQARDVRQETRQDARQTKQQGRETARDIKY